MKALVKEFPREGALLKDVPLPSIGEDGVLVRVKKVAICGTDFHIYSWNSWVESRIKLPLVFGHEMVGEVVKVGEKVKRVKVGDIISAETHIPCGRCYQCLTGNAHLCGNMEIVGIDRDGAFAEYIALPEVVVWVNDRDIPLELATLQEPMGSTFEAVAVDSVAGKDVLVTGCGPMGLFAIVMARCMGASTIIATELNDYRRKLAKEIGADYVFSPVEPDSSACILDITSGKGVDVAIEMSGSKEALSLALDMVTPGGRVSLVGLFSGVVPVELTQKVIFKGIRIYGITGRRLYSTWFRLKGLLSSEKLALVSKIITHRFSIGEFERAFELLSSGNCGKVVFDID